MRTSADKTKALKPKISRLFRQYFDLGLGIAITSPTKGILEVNDEICAILGYARNELLQMTWAELTHPDDLLADMAHFKRVLAGELDGYSMDKAWIHKDGHVIDSIVSVKCLRRADGSVAYFLALLQDITERTRTENEVHFDLELRVAERTRQLTALNEKLRKEITERKRAEQTMSVLITILETSGDAIFGETLDGIILSWNAGAEKMYGYGAAEVKGRHVSLLVPPDRAHEIPPMLEKLGHGEPIYQLETVRMRKDGVLIEVALTVAPLRDASGNVAAAFTITRDITERKQTEARNSYQASLLANVHDAILVTDDRFILTAWNSKAEEIYGWNAEEVLGRRVGDVICSEFTDAQRSEALRILEETDHYYVELAQYTRDGRRLWVQGHTRTLRDETGRITGYVAANRDITERKLAEAQAREANERVEMILNSITDRFFCFDQEWRVTAFNKAAEEQLSVLGKNPATFIGKVLWEEFPNPPSEQVLRRAMSERAVITDEHYFPDLREWIENRIFPSPDGGLAIFQRYVTERKRTEERLQRSEAYLAEGQRISHTGTWAWNMITGEIYWSLELFRISGVDPETFKLTLETALQLIHPEDRVSVNQAFERAIQEKSGFERELRMIRPDGSILYVRCLANPVFNEAGELAEYVGTIMDITERKEEELARKELQRRLVAAQEDEQRRISREMHDELGQRLSALTLKIAALKSAYGQDAELRKQFESLETITKELDADADLIVWQLRPTTLDDLGLPTALANHVKRWSEHFGIRAQLHVRGMEPNSLTGEIETVLYRILQEALTNVAKHAAARNVEILLERYTDHVSLIVEDDGRGFDAEQAFGIERKGLGLIGMRERATLVGGAVEIESRQGNGATVVVRIPAAHPEGTKTG